MVLMLCGVMKAVRQHRADVGFKVLLAILGALTLLQWIFIRSDEFEQTSSRIIILSGLLLCIAITFLGIRISITLPSYPYEEIKRDIGMFLVAMVCFALSGTQYYLALDPKVTESGNAIACVVFLLIGVLLIVGDSVLYQYRIHVDRTLKQLDQLAEKTKTDEDKPFMVRKG